MRGFVALEDVSIIIPIAVAIILFFSALAWAISTIQSTNATVDLSLKIVDLADVFTSPGVLTSKSFDQSCSSALTLANGYGFVVYITSPDNPATLQDVVAGSVSADVCPNPPPSVPEHASVLVRAFPIPYQTSKDGLPYNDVNLLVVAVWKGA